MAIIPLWVVAVAVSCSVSFFTVLGFVLQTWALRDASQQSRYPKIGEAVISPCWVSGVILQLVPNFFGDVIAYTIAPLSLTAPLSGVSMILNTSLAPTLLGERLYHWPDIPATVLILIGVALTTSLGPHEDNVAVPSLEEFMRLATQPLTVVLIGLLFGSLVACMIHQLARRAHLEQQAASHFEAPHLAHLLLPAWSGAGAGCFTNIGLKIFGEFAEAGAPVLQVLGVLCLVVTPFAIVQQQWVNKGLRLYPQTVFFPIYSSLLVLLNTVLGAIFFEEYVALDRGQGHTILGFGTGLVTITAGIVLFSCRRHQPPSPALCSIQEGLLESNGLSHSTEHR